MLFSTNGISSGTSHIYSLHIRERPHASGDKSGAAVDMCWCKRSKVGQRLDFVFKGKPCFHRGDFIPAGSVCCTGSNSDADSALIKHDTKVNTKTCMWSKEDLNDVTSWGTTTMVHTGKLLFKLLIFRTLWDFCRGHVESHMHVSDTGSSCDVFGPCDTIRWSRTWKQLASFSWNTWKVA